MKTILSFMLVLSMFSAGGCKVNELKQNQGTQQTDVQTVNPYGVDKSDAVNIKIILEDGREMEAALYPKIAPITVKNFEELVEADFYDGLIFHRVIDGFMIQCGGYDKSFYNGNFNQKESETIKGEFTSNGVKNNLKHTRGVLSMARTSVADSASSQFFIMDEDTASLDGQYAAFGEITSGMEIVDEIAGSATESLMGSLTFGGQKYEQRMDNVPSKPIVIKTIEIIK